MSTSPEEVFLKVTANTVLLIGLARLLAFPFSWLVDPILRDVGLKELGYWNAVRLFFALNCIPYTVRMLPK